MYQKHQRLLIYSLRFFFLLSSSSEAQQSNAHLSQLIRAYQRPAKSKTTRSVVRQPPATAPVFSSTTKHLQRMAPANRSKSPPKGVRQADPSPKRIISNDTINTERLKVARDEAERAMKVRKK